MDVLGLTNFAQIRGVLTVSSTDLPDETLEAYGLEDDLAVALGKLDEGWEAVVTEAVAQKVRLLRLYSKYFCAGTLAGMAEVFVLTRDTDGANEGQRSGSGLEKLQAKLLGKAAGFAQEYVDLRDNTTAPTFSLVSRVVPTRDVITTARGGNAS